MKLDLVGAVAEIFPTDVYYCKMDAGCAKLGEKAIYNMSQGRTSTKKKGAR